MLLVETGTVQLMARDEGQARAAFEQALRQNPGVARAHSSLGFMAAQGGRVDEALDHWRRAIALDPGESEKLMALGALLLRGGPPARARPYLELFVATAPSPRYAREIERARALLAADTPRG